MKKRILMSLGLSLFLGGCVNIHPSNPSRFENNQPKDTEEIMHQEDMSDEDYVLNTFRQHGVHLEKGEFHIKHQGNKRIVMMKNRKDRKHHRMHKMIFTKENGEFRPHHLMIDHQIHHNLDD